MLEKNIVEKLEKWGADPKSVLDGMQGDIAFYRSMLQDMAAEPELLNLETEILQGDAKKAFMKVHSLRGGAGSLGLTPLTQILSQLTEQLREEEDVPPAALQEESRVTAAKDAPGDDRKQIQELTNQFVQIRKEFLALADQICRE